MQVKDASTAATKWSTNASAAGATYASGVASSQKDQAGLAAAAESTWAQATAQAAANHTFSTQVSKAGTAAWKAGVAAVGQTRFTQGVQKGQSKYATNVQPFFAALSSLTLPPRGVKGTNNGRVQAITDALMATKKQVG